MTNEAGHPIITTGPDGSTISTDLITTPGVSALAAVFADQQSKSAATSQPPTQGDKEGAANPTPDTSRNGEAGDGSEGTPPPSDPLATLDLDAVLKHPGLGPKLQSWADKVALSQTTSALDRERSRLQSEATSKAEEDALRDYFGNLSQTELGAVLASDPELATSYARLQAADKTAPNNSEEVMLAAKTIAFATIIHSVNGQLEAAGLKPEGPLSPSEFTKFGDDGINRWQAATSEAILKASIEKAVNAELETRWAAYQEEQRVGGNDRPGATPAGRVTSPEPDLMTSNSRDLLEYALAKSSNGARK